MDTVASLFAGNAFGTPIGQRIGKLLVEYPVFLDAN